MKERVGLDGRGAFLNKQAGTGPSRRHILGSKVAKGLPRYNLQSSKIEKAKKWTEWRAKRGTLPKLSTFLSQLKGDPLEKKQTFEKKVSPCRKTERGDPLGFLNTQSVVKYQRN